MIQVEFFQRLVFGGEFAFLRVDVLGEREHGKHHQREGHAVDGGVFLGEQIGDGDEAQNQSGHAQADGDLHAGQPEIEGELVFLIVPLVAQRQHTQRFQEEAPHHAERVRFTQQVNIAAAEHDGGKLQ